MGRRDLGAILFIAIIVGMLAAHLFLPLGDWLSIAALKESQFVVLQLVEARPLLCAAGFFLFCVVATAVCFPAAPVLGVSGGALFGFWPGLALVLVASAIGSTIAFLASRHLLREWVKRTFGPRLGTIDRRIAAHGGAYLLALRFNPVIPYWSVNLAMGLTAIRLRAYAALTPLGLLPATMIYSSAGSHLASIHHPGDVVPPGLLAALLLLSLLPLLAAAPRTHARTRA